MVNKSNFTNIDSDLICRSMSVTVKQTDSKMWDALKREWEDIVLKLKVEVKENCKI